MIKYNNNTISDWYFADDNIIKVYHNNAVCYYKVVVGETAQTPCYAVVDDITQYQDTEFENVFNKADNKWYKLNNLNEYEEYGVYGSGRTECSGGDPVTPTDCVTTYEGKLTIDGDYEYQYSGNSWNNVGEISGNSRLPQGYTEVEYIENNANNNGYIPLGEYFTENTVIQMDFQMTQAKGNVIIGDYGSNDNDDWRVFLNYDTSANNLLNYDFLTSRGSYNTGDWSKRFNLEIGNYYIKDIDSGNYLINLTPKSNFTRPNQMYLFHMDGTQTQITNTDYGHIYSLKIYQNNVLVKEFVPCLDPNNVVGLYDIVNNEFHNPSGGTLNAGPTSSGGTVVYPVYYDEIQDPPTQVSFSSMTEAEQYECPYVGLMATINGDLYFFNDNYQWELIPTFEGKWKATYSGGTITTAACDSSSAITSGEVTKEGLVNVEIGDCVTTIGQDAFSNYNSLTSVTIPDSVTSVGEYAFEACNNLTSIEIPNGVTNIGDWAFANCNGLTSVTIPNSVTTIGGAAFYGCSNLTSIEIPNGVTSIDYSAFANCNGLTSVTIPDSVTSIGQGAFSSCSGLTSIDIPSGITSIINDTFGNCNSLTSVTIPNSVTTIGGSAFYGCSNLTSLTIPSGVTDIGSYAFISCRSLTSITVNATTPPTLGLNPFDSGNIPIYVPSQSVETYKTAWSTYSSRIQAIP